MTQKDTILLEAFEENRYIYHYSEKKFKSVKSREMLKLETPESVTSPDYIKTASFLLEPLTAEIVEKYREEGFLNWGTGHLYEYKIDIIKNKKNFYEFISLTSTPEQQEYDNKYWDKTFEDAGIDLIKIHDEEEGDIYWEEVKDLFLETKKKYIEVRKKYLDKIYGGLTPDIYLHSKKIKKLREENDEWVDYNLRHGNKKQYASYIPHILTKIKKPIVPSSITKII